MNILNLPDICPEPPTYPDTVIEYVSRHEGGKAVYRCGEGQIFLDGSVLANKTCDNVNWIGDIPTCRSKVFNLTPVLMHRCKHPLWYIKCDHNCLNCFFAFTIYCKTHPML